MNKNKSLSILLSTAIAFTSVTSAGATGFSKYNLNPTLSIQKAHEMQVAGRINNGLLELGVSGVSDKEVELLVISQLETDISGKLYKAGASYVDKFAEGAYKIKIQAKEAYKIATIGEVVSAGINHDVKLEPVQKIPIVNPKMEYSNKTTSIKDLWNKGYTGKGSTIAIIDTGVEPDNELLKMTTEGKLKIVDYEEFLSAGMFENTPQEGDVKLTEIQVGDSLTVDIPYSYYSIGNTGKVVLSATGSPSLQKGTKTIKVPESLKGKKVLVGAYSESRMIRDSGQYFDTNNNNQSDAFGFVCYDGDEDGKGEKILFDTDNDGDLGNEKEMGVYKDVADGLKDKAIFSMQDNGEPQLDSNNEPVVKTEFKDQYSKLVNNIKNKSTVPTDVKSKTKFNFVFTRVENKTFGSFYANIATDAQGHGTHVAGDAAASGYLSHSFVDKTLEPTGKILAPAKDAQIMALKVFGSRGGTSEDMYISAMQYAATHGADVANLSLGNQPDLTDGTGLGAAYGDLLTAKYGTLFVISNGNNGPGSNTNGQPGDSWSALTVGAYCPSFYVMGDQYKNVENQLWYFSSNGPADDGRIKPDVIAPGSMVSASPMWDIVGTGYDEEGTFKDQAGIPQVGYARMQGTSMSSPYTAGVVAALKQAIVKENIPYHPLLLKEAIKKSADTTINNGKYNPTEIGSGMINPLAAYNELKNLAANSDKLPKLVTGDTPVTTWPYNYDDKKMKYSIYQDMYIVPNVNYKNDERMKMAIAAGVYVRDGDVPNSIDVSLPNLTGKDVTLTPSKVTYGVGQSKDWLSIQSQPISIAQGKTESIKLNIDKDKLQYGENVILVQLDDPKTYQLDCTIPVTVIKSDTISFDKPSIVQDNKGIKPGSFTRQFAKVTDQLDTIKVKVEVPQGTNGRVKPSIYFPNGIECHIDDPYPFVGKMKDGSFIQSKEFVIKKADLVNAGMDFSKPNPNATYKWSGTWEVDLYSSYASETSVDAKLTISTLGAVISDKSASVDLSAGERVSGTIQAINNTGSDMYVKSYGFVDMNKNIKKERIEGLAEFQSVERLFQIKPGEKNILQRVKTTNASYGEGARIWLYLYKANVNADGSYTLIKPMINKYINVQTNGAENEMVTYNLEPGYYVYAVMGVMMDNGPVDFDLVSQTLNENDAIADTISLDGPSVIKDGQNANINYTVKAPVNEGRYVAGINFADGSGKNIKSFPITANVSPTNKTIEVKQENVALNGGQVIVDVNSVFPEDVQDKDKLYGLEFELKYDPKQLSALDILRGDAFTDSNSYKVKTEISKDDKGNELGSVKFAYAFRGLSFNGISKGNVAKIKFKANKMGASNIDLSNLTVGNFEGNELAVKVDKENVLTADPDVNHDGVVDIRDYAYCAYSFGADKDDIRYRAEADVNKDGKIDTTDLDYIINYFSNK